MDIQVSVIRELLQFRELLRSLVVRDLKVKYQRSLLGLVWTLLQPLLTIVILGAVFSYIVRIEMDHYWAFLISGFFAWNFISLSLNHATSLITSNASLSRSVYFPREILVLSAAASKLVEFLFEIIVVIAVLLVFHFESIPESLVLLPVVVLIQLVMTIGLMLPIAVITVLYYDVEHALPVIIRSLFYLTPIFYPVSMVPEAARPFYYLNPFVSIVELYHVLLYEGTWPSMLLLGSAAASAVVICLAGSLVFRRYKGISIELA